MMPRRKNCNRGAVLIVSLTFIVLLTVLVVSYMVAMRLDRLSTRNYSQSVRAKELANESVVNTARRSSLHFHSHSALGPNYQTRHVDLRLTEPHSTPSQ